MKEVVARNRKAYHSYQILEEIEAGIVLQGCEVKSLQGCEVKSLRAHEVSLAEGRAQVEKGELFLYGVNISPYPQATIEVPDPLRPRKLLLHRREINRLVGKVNEKRLTLVPLEVYFKRGIAKVKLGLARGLKKYDKREKLKRRAMQREIAQEKARRAKA